METRRVLLVLSGIPAAGKTTVARGVAQEQLDCENVCFDEEMRGEFSPEKWREAQTRFAQRVQDAVGRRVAIVIVDDNLNYLSMVKKYHRLACVRGYAFVHIVLRVSLETAIQRNRSRSAPIPEPIIIGMYAQIEKQRFLPGSVVVPEGDIGSILAAVRGAIEGKRHEEERPEEEQRGNESAEEPMHRADLRLRMLVAERIQACEQPRRAEVAKEMMKMKAEILQSLRKEAELTVDEAEDQASLLFTSFVPSSYTELR